MRPTLLVTGGTGYLGRRLLAGIDPDRFDAIHSLGRSGAAAPAGPEARPGIERIRADLLDVGAYASRLSPSTVVVHLAASTGKARTAEHFRVNVGGTRALADACRAAGVRRFLHVSTIAVTFRDTSNYPYARSKLRGEEVVRRSGLPFTIVRPTIILGPGAPIWLRLRSLATAPVLPLIGGGGARIQPVFVDDLVACLGRIIDEDVFRNETYEIGGADVVTMAEFLERVRVHHGRGAGPRLKVPYRPLALALGIAERVAFPMVPVTAGQLASFVEDGTVRGQPPPRGLAPEMMSIDEMISRLAGHD